MITNEGKIAIKRYLAGYAPAIARSLAVGIGNTAAEVTDEKLQFEIGRVDIDLISYDFVNNKLIFKATLPADFTGTIYETGLFSADTDTLSGEFGSKTLTNFDAATENWVNAEQTTTESTFVTTGHRVGADALRQSPALSLTRVDTIQEMFLDLSGYSSGDRMVFALNSANAFATNVRVFFMNDGTNYYYYNLGSLTAGYKIVEANKASAIAVGTPRWDDITEIRLATTSTGGVAVVDWDAIRIEDMDTVNPDYALVARKVEATPITKVDGRTQEIEYALDVNV